MLNKKNCEPELPEGYRQAFRVNAKSAGLGIAINLIALAVMLAGTYFSFLIAKVFNSDYFTFPKYGTNDELTAFYLKLLVFCMILLVADLLLTVVHELIHGIAFKILTGAKLKFGLSWSCAFCGVPDVYVYRKASIKASYAPMLYLSLLLLILTVCLYFVDPLYYLGAAFLFWMHLGACAGDAYVILILNTKFKSNKTLVRDTGPEQFFYVPEKR